MEPMPIHLRRRDLGVGKSRKRESRIISGFLAAFGFTSEKMFALHITSHPLVYSYRYIILCHMNKISIVVAGEIPVGKIAIHWRKYGVNSNEGSRK